jgi:hypothetical protein
MNTITRFDIPQTVRNVINTAARHDVIDAVEAYALATEFGTDWSALVDRVCEYAYANIHFNREAHAEVVKAAEAYWMVRNKISA